MIQKIDCTVYLEDGTFIKCDAPTIDMVIEKLGSAERKIENDG
jgi:hypothetical protein